MQCSLCKIEYVGKAKTSIDICLYNHKSNVSELNTLPGCCHLAQDRHNFNIHARFILMETRKNKSKPVEIMLEFLPKGETFELKLLRLYNHAVLITN